MRDSREDLSELTSRVHVHCSALTHSFHPQLTMRLMDSELSGRNLDNLGHCIHARRLDDSWQSLGLLIDKWQAH